MPEENTYDSSAIQVLDGLQCIRHRPGMYVGGVDTYGAQNVLLQAIGNAVDQHLAGRASRVRVDLRIGGARVEDDGPGMRPDVVPRVFTTLHAGSVAAWPHVHLADHWRGIACVTALTERLEVTSHHAGEATRFTFARGELDRTEALGRSHAHGLILDFDLDPEIFPGDVIAGAFTGAEPRLFQIACCNPRLAFSLNGRELPSRLGAASLLQHEAPPMRHAVESVQVACEDVLVEVALGWRRDDVDAEMRPEVRGFVNQVGCDEGAHLRGFWKGLRDALRTCRRPPSRDGHGSRMQHRELATPSTFPNGQTSRAQPCVRDELLGHGLRAAVIVQVFHAEFVGPIRSRLVSEAAEAAVRKVVGAWAGPVLARAGFG